LGFTVCTFAQEPNRVSSADLKDKIEKKRDLLVVDVRSKANYLVGHIPTAISIPFGEVASRQKELPKDEHIIFYWGWRGEHTSAGTVQMLVKNFGFDIELLEVLLGGFPAWIAAGYPINKELAVKPKGKLTTLWSKIKSKK